MVSLAILAAILITQLLITAAGLAFAARAVGSPSAPFRRGFAAALLLFVLGLVIAVPGVVMNAEDNGLAAGVAVGLLLVQVLLSLFILRRLFRLSTARALAPASAYLALAFLGLVFVYAIMRPYLLEAFIIPTESMSPTLEKGDRFVVNKLLGPRRWDLVAYQTNDGEPVISCKRLVGLPGERLRFENGTLYINDKALTSPEVVAGRYSAEVAGAPGLTQYRDKETIHLGNDEFFFVGDNVERSKDSRTDGPTDAGNLIGVVDLLYWPLNRFAVLR